VTKTSDTTRYRSVRLAIFSVGFLLSPLTPGNDALVNQLPSSLLAASLVGKGKGAAYSRLYLIFYILSNLLGIALMLVNTPELKRRFDVARKAFHHDRRRFALMVTLDLATLSAMWILGGLLLKRF
jgi:hypothetical protein